MDNLDKSIEANIGRALAPGGVAPPTVGKKPSAKTKEQPLAKPAIDGLANPVAVQPPQPGSPCQKQGCLGRYSTLTTNKVGRLRVRELICRTCQHRPPEPHKSPL